MRVYISIPITGHDPREQKAKADSLELKYLRQGAEVFNPFDTHDGKEHPWEWYKARDILRMHECQQIYFCKGWEKSQGCRLEKEMATLLGLKMVFENENKEV